MIKDWIDQVREMDTINLIILVLTFLSVTLICWGLVVIYCCLASYCDSPGSSSMSSNASLKNFNQICPDHAFHHANIFQVQNHGLVHPMLPSVPSYAPSFNHPIPPSSFHPHHSGHPSWNMPMFGHPKNDQFNDKGKVMVPISDIVYI